MVMDDHSASSPEPDPNAPSLDQIVGTAVKTYRLQGSQTLADLSATSGVSTAMISKIERGQVSASLSTLDALASAIGIPIVSFFADTVERTDVSFVAAGEGITVQRMGGKSGHSYKMIGRAETRPIGLESYRVTLQKPLLDQPVYQHSGIEFLHVIDGEMTYRCGEAQFTMRPGDSLSFDSQTAHGPVALVTDTVTFLTVMARANSGTGS